jgi:hypothetical protein
MIRFPTQTPELPQATVEAVSSPALDPTLRLQVVLEELDRAKLDLDRARYKVDEIPPGTPPDVIEQMLQRQRVAYRRWFDIQHQATSLEQEARRRQLESLQLFRHHYEQTYQDLFEHYGDLGPQYRLLVERLAAVDARIKVLDQSTRDVPTDELMEMNKLHTQLLNQLQRYTEATKTESLTRQTQETIQSLMIIVEHRVAPANPQLWREIVHDVRTAVEQLAAS